MHGQQLPSSTEPHSHLRTCLASTRKNAGCNTKSTCFEEAIARSNFLLFGSMVDCVTKSHISRQVCLQNIVYEMPVRIFRNHSPQLGGLQNARKSATKTLQCGVD